MECSCGGQGSSSYHEYHTVEEAKAAGYAVDRAPCVIALKDCPACKRHSQDVHYSPHSKPGRVNLIQMMRKK